MHTLLQVGAREVPTYGFVLDHSRLGLASLAAEETNRRITAFQRGNRKHIEDSLIASTAEHLDASLVTGERRRKAYRDHFPRLSILTIDELRDRAKRILGIPVP
jgi:hypothetical protein